MFTYKELTDKYKMLNIEFKYLGQNDKGNLLLHLINDDGKILVYSSNNNGKSKEEFLNYTEKEINKLKFKYEMEVEMQDYDICVIVNTSNNEKIPSARYSIETIDNLTIENDDFKPDIDDNNINGISYMVIERTTNTTLFNGVYEYGNGGFLNDLENNLLPKYEQENNKVAISNINEILRIYKNEKELIK